jgi:hypothetical protein
MVANIRKLATIKSPIDAVKFSNTIQLSPKSDSQDKVKINNSSSSSSQSTMNIRWPCNCTVLIYNVIHFRFFSNGNKSIQVFLSFVDICIAVVDLIIRSVWRVGIPLMI